MPVVRLPERSDMRRFQLQEFFVRIFSYVIRGYIATTNVILGSIATTKDLRFVSTVRNRKQRGVGRVV